MGWGKHQSNHDLSGGTIKLKNIYRVALSKQDTNSALLPRFRKQKATQMDCSIKSAFTIFMISTYIELVAFLDLTGMSVCFYVLQECVCAFAEGVDKMVRMTSSASVQPRQVDSP